MFEMFEGYSGEEIQAILTMQGMAGLNVFAVYLLLAMGLVIVFGQMKVINMAHGEFLTLGAYVTVVCSDLVMEHAEWALAGYYPVAIILAFCVTFIVGWIAEFGLVRFLYKRPLDTLLATFGLSLIMQECFRQIFGRRDTGATMPDWLMGSWSPTEMIQIPVQGVFLFSMALGLIVLVSIMLMKSRWGLRVRSTVQNREMANAVGISTAKTDRLTFAFGCALAGVAGAAFTTFGSANPTAGTSYIVIAFVVTVLGGAGSLLGATIAAFGIGQAQSVLEFFTSGTTALVLVLLVVIVVLMIRPQGIISSKVRR